MSALCISALGKTAITLTLPLAANTFTLTQPHSLSGTYITQHMKVEDAQLVLTHTDASGDGAGLPPVASPRPPTAHIDLLIQNAQPVTIETSANKTVLNDHISTGSWRLFPCTP